MCARIVSRPLREYLSYSSFVKIWKQFDLVRLVIKIRDRHWSENPEFFLPPSQRPPKKGTDREPAIDWAVFEYAVAETILEAPALSLSYYADVVGTVPLEQIPFPYEGHDIGNGGPSPEWGVDLVIHEGFIRYGPWADRQRYDNQTWLFFHCS